MWKFCLLHCLAKILSEPAESAWRHESIIYTDVPGLTVHFPFICRQHAWCYFLWLRFVILQALKHHIVFRRHFEFTCSHQPCWSTVSFFRSGLWISVYQWCDTSRGNQRDLYQNVGEFLWSVRQSRVCEWQWQQVSVLLAWGKHLFLVHRKRTMPQWNSELKCVG